MAARQEGDTQELPQPFSPNCEHACVRQLIRQAVVHAAQEEAINIHVCFKVHAKTKPKPKTNPKPRPNPNSKKEKKEKKLKKKKLTTKTFEIRTAKPLAFSSF